jgi:ubiquinone/menaquinone biosynthesis C-methylase UbiE
VVSEPVGNPFAEASIGERYARGRPYHHPRALDRAVRLLGLDSAEWALDVACGTGLSTIALRGYAETVVGTDLATEMLAAAPARPRVTYVAAGAERLPFPSEAFDVLTVSSSVHWFNQASFFAESRRVLEPAGAMIIYDHFFVMQMSKVAGFADWMATTYLQRYPRPPHQERAYEWTQSPDGFILVGQDNYPDPIDLTQEALIAYLLTQSGTIVADEPAEVTAAWLQDQTTDFFDGADIRTLEYWGTIACYRRE